MNLLTEEEGWYAVDAAVSFVSEAVTGKKEQHGVPPAVFKEPRGVFVTLTAEGNLRGCIGYPYPVLPLSDALKDAAYQAARADPRFYPVEADELAGLDIEVTVLAPPKTLDVPAKERPKHIEIGKHGLIAEYHGYRGLLLPQVAVEWGWTSEEFLDQTCVKAGLPAKTWESDACIVQTFEGQIFTRIHPWQ
ncbi:MAG TPA: TIGR00296 family protein [Methanocorpusculum sp.]|nr:TIGR00296 family protein [Methanocorpusculum sp.]